MNKRRIAALILMSVMLGSTVLTACNQAGSGSNNTDNGIDADIPSIRDDLTNEPPKQETVTGNEGSTYAEADSVSPDLFAGYRREDIFASLGINADDYVDVIVSLEGDNLLDRYMASGSALSVADYSVENGAGYKSSMLQQQNIVQQMILSRIDKNAEFSYSYTLADNGFAAKVKYGDVTKIKSLASVKDVRLAETYSVPDETTSAYYTSSGASAVAQTEVDTKAGEGTFIAIIDSALDSYKTVEWGEGTNYDHQPGHPAFDGKQIEMSKASVNKTKIETVMKSTNAYYYDWHYNYSSKNYDPTVDEYYYNNKVVFAFDYGNMDSNVMPSSYFVTQLDHGTHTAGIVAGCDPDNNFYGTAPAAQIAFMKVAYEDFVNGYVTMSDIDIALAMEDCIMLGVDAINLSLGSARGFSVDNRSENYIWQLCEYADAVGINVQAAVGNNFTGAFDGIRGDYPLATHPDYGSLNSPASFDNTLAVASYDGKNVDQAYALVSNGSDSFKITITEPTKTAFLQNEEKDYRTIPNGTHDWVYVGGAGTYTDFRNAGAKGKLAVVTMREIPSNLNEIYQEVYLRDYASDLMANAIRAGAKGIIYADREYKLTRMIAVDMRPDLTIPFCAISRVDADRMQAIGSGTIKFAEDQVVNDLMSVFSSWGPTNTLQIKPEIVGLGGNVYSSITYSADYGYMISDPNMLDYGYYSGTSMASPQITAYVAMLKNKLQKQYPTLTKQELATLTNQILMSTATPLVDTLSNEMNIYSPRYQGAGAVNYEAAVATKAYLSVIGTNKAKIELGEDEAKRGVYFLNFNINNMSGQSLSYELNADVLTDSLLPDGKTISLRSHAFTDFSLSVSTKGGTYSSSTKTITVPANGTASVAVTLKLSAADKKYIDDNFAYGSYVEGFVRLSDKSGVADLSIPYLAFYGDWEKSALMDTTVYDDEEAYLLPSSLVATYYGGFFSAYLGQYQYNVPENFAFVTEVDGQFVKSDIITFEDIEYDSARLAIGSKTGGFNALKSIYLGLLRNADRVEYTITDVATGELYESYTVNQLGKASYLETYGGMYPVVQGLYYGSDLPNNARIKISIRAIFDNMGDTINVKDQTEFFITIDSEAPLLYTDSAGIIKQNGRTYLSLNVFDNHTLAAVGIYGVDDATGVSETLSAPFPINTKTWKAGEKNTVVFDITDIIVGFRGQIGVTLEDSAMNAVSYRVATVNSSSGSTGEEVAGPATSLTFNKEMNIAVDYSTDLGIVTVPSNATYKLEVVPNADAKSDDPDVEYLGGAYIDETGARPLVVATQAGYVQVKITSGNIVQYADVYIYVVDGEWIIILNDNVKSPGWVTRDELNELGYAADARTYGIYAYNGEGSHVTIPSTYTEADGTVCDIVYLGYTSFYGDLTLQSIFIPKTIVRIVDSTFERNYNLRNVTFEKGSHLKSIGGMAFELCRSLTSIEFPSSLELVQGRAFYHCTSLKSISFEDMSNSKLKSLQYAVFSDTALEHVVLPEGVEAIGDAFSDIPTLKSIQLPSSVNSLGSGAFEYTAISEIYIPEGVTGIPQGAFSGCTELRKVSLPSTITYIGAGAFSDCTALTSFTVPEATTKIEGSAFYGCTRLLTLKLSNSLKEVDKTAFMGCTSLRTVYFDKGTSLTDLGTDVFYGCYSLQEFTVHPQNPYFMADDGILYRLMSQGEYELYCVPSNKYVETILIRPDVAQIRDYAFAYHTELKTVLFTHDGALRIIGDYAFAACTSLNTVNLESASKLTTLGQYAFAYCQSLKSIAIPTSLTAIGNYAFYYDTYLETVKFHQNITSIGSYAFGGCIRFTGTDGKGTLKMPARLNWLGTGAFLVNRTLTKLDMSECTAYTATGTNCGEAAFMSCFNLREVILPKSTQMIWSDMFADCTALEKINLGETKVDTIRSEAFYGCESLKEVELPETLTVLYSYTFAFSGLTHIEIPASMSGGVAAGHIWSYAFAGCKSLESVTFPSTLTGIPNYAFADTALREVTLPRDLKNSGFATSAFYLCSALEKFYVEPGNSTFAATDDGILYMPATGERSAIMLLCPANLQAETLVIDEIFDTIPSAFFELTTGIDTVVIPATVKNVEAGAFYYSGVREVIFAEDSEVLFDGYQHNGMFNGCSNLEHVVLPKHITNIPYAMFGNCENLVSIELPESVTELYPMAFYNCRKLENINLDNIQVLDDYSLAYCESLKTVNLGKDLYEICFDLNSTVFEGCKSLESINVDENNLFYKTIDGVLFDRAGSVLYLYPAAKAGSEYIVPEGVTKIAELAFGFNQHLERVVLPESLAVVGTLAFFHADNLLDYYFLGSKAPALEGQFLNGYGSVYGNFYNFTAVDFGDMYLVLHYPEQSTGYDNWLFETFFYRAEAFTNSGFNSPSQGDITRPDENGGSHGAEKIGDRLAARIAELKVGASEALATKLDALYARFMDEQDVFYAELEEAGAFKAFEDAYIREAEELAKAETELFAYMWTRIYEVLDIINERIENETFSKDDAELLDSIAYSVIYTIVRSSTFAEVNYYYNYYYTFVKGLPSLEQADEFMAAKESGSAQIAALYAKFEAEKANYDDDVIAYVEDQYEISESNVVGARSKGEIENAIANFEATLKEIPTKATRAQFDEKKAAQLARLDKYVEENYDFALWLVINNYLTERRAAVEETFRLSEIEEIVNYAVTQLDLQASKLYYLRIEKLNLLNRFISKYNMYSYLYDDEILVLRGIEEEVRAQINAATTIDELVEAYERGTARMWKYYEYNQKAYTEYRKAVAAFESLSADLRAEAMRELSTLSYRVAENWRAIRALIEKYTGNAD